MKISECKTTQTFPRKYAPVLTKTKSDVPCGSFKKEYIENRKNGEGKYLDFVAGTGGDMWWILNCDGTIAVYDIEEVFDVN